MINEYQKEAVRDIAMAFYNHNGYLSDDYVNATLDAIAAVLHIRLGVESENKNEQVTGG